MQAKLGLNGILKYGVAGATPTNRLPKTVDVSVTLSKTTTDGTTRDSLGWREIIPVLKDASLEITINRDTADIAFDFFVDALIADKKIALFADDGTGNGIDGDWHISESKEIHALEDVNKITVSAVAAGRINRIKPPTPPEEEETSDAQPDAQPDAETDGEVTDESF